MLTRKNYHINFSAATAAVEGKMSKNLKKVLKKIVAKDAHEQLLVADAKLGNSIKVTKIPNDQHVHQIMLMLHSEVMAQ